MTKGHTKINTVLLKGFLHEVVEGFYGECELHPRSIPSFFDKARDTDLLRLTKFADTFTSNLEEDPSATLRRALEKFVNSIAFPNMSS
jgi:hypothetical protein